MHQHYLHAHVVLLGPVGLHPAPELQAVLPCAPIKGVLEALAAGI